MNWKEVIEELIKNNEHPGLVFLSKEDYYSICDIEAMDISQMCSSRICPNALIKAGHNFANLKDMISIEADCTPWYKPESDRFFEVAVIVHSYFNDIELNFVEFKPNRTNKQGLFDLMVYSSPQLNDKIYITVN